MNPGDLVRGDAPLVIDVPHAGTYLPAPLAHRLTPAARTLPDTDWHVEKLFAFGQTMAESRGLILADTKYELGRKADGTLVFIDEIHTPDSSRDWFATDYEDRMKQGLEPRGLDKEYVRRWLVDEQGYSGNGPPPPLADHVRLEAARRYISTYELLTGLEFQPDTE